MKDTILQIVTLFYLHYTIRLLKIKAVYIPMSASLKEGLKCIPMDTEGTATTSHMSL